MDAATGYYGLILLAGVVPAVFFHSRKYSFLTACVLSAGTSSWAITLLLVFSSKQSWMIGIAGGLVWFAPFFLSAAAWGVPVRIIRKAFELRSISTKPGEMD